MGRLFCVLIGALVSIILPNRAYGFESLFTSACTLRQGKEIPISSECVVRSSMAQGVMFWAVTIAGNRKFTIQNSEGNLEHYTLNGKTASHKNDGLSDCYAASDIEICFLETSSVERAPDRTDLLPKVTRACTNWSMTNPQLMALLALNAVSLEDVCRCQAPVYISTLSDEQVSELYFHNGKLGNSFVKTIIYCAQVLSTPEQTSRSPLTHSR
ncbi:MAG: hypothetical protein JO305_11425 [Alphaproteobacteria bacterium]|nr:hypothetical protein [Alphaproteobacteria bacterium]